MAQRSIRSAELILSLSDASSLGSQTPGMIPLPLQTRGHGPHGVSAASPGSQAHGVPAANLHRSGRPATTLARTESFPALGARSPGGGGVCNGVIFKNLHLTAGEELGTADVTSAL